MLSRLASSVSQPGQLDRGRTIETFRGTRWMTTFRNEPTAKPRRPHDTRRYVNISTSLCAGYPSGGFALLSSFGDTPSPSLQHRLTPADPRATRRPGGCPAHRATESCIAAQVIPRSADRWRAGLDERKARDSRLEYGRSAAEGNDRGGWLHAHRAR